MSGTTFCIVLFLLLSDLIFTQLYEVCAFIISILYVRKLGPSEIK